MKRYIREYANAIEKEVNKKALENKAEFFGKIENIISLSILGMATDHEAMKALIDIEENILSA